MSEVSLPDTREVQQKAISAVEKALAIKITDDILYVQAGELLKSLKGLQIQINETFDAPIRAAHAAHKAVLAAKDKHMAPVAEAERIVKPKLAVYAQEQETRRLEEQKRLEAESRKKSEDEALAQAIEAENSGNKAAAEALLSSPIQTPPVVLPKQTKINGVYFRTKWSGTVTDKMALIKAVAAGQAPAGLLSENPTAIRQFAESTQGAACVPGIRFYDEKIVSGRA